MSRIEDIENLKSTVMNLLPSKFEISVVIGGKKVTITSNEVNVSIEIEGVELTKAEKSLGLRVDLSSEGEEVVFAYKKSVGRRIERRINKALQDSLVEFKPNSIYSNDGWTVKVLSIGKYKDGKKAEIFLPSSKEGLSQSIFTVLIKEVNGIETIAPFNRPITAEQKTTNKKLIFNPMYR